METFFGTKAEIEARYASVNASKQYRDYMAAERRDEIARHQPPERKRRIRKPTLRSVMAAARRAGVEVAQVEVSATGSIIVTPGTPTVPGENNGPVAANPWDEVLQ